MIARLHAWADRLEASNARRALERESRLRCPKRPLPLPWYQRAVVYALAYGILYATAAFEFATLWRWFIRPMGAPALAFWHAVGVVLSIGAVTYAPREMSTVGVEVTGRIERAAIRLTLGAIVLWVGRQ